MIVSRFTWNHLGALATLVAVAFATGSCGSDAAKKLAGSDPTPKPAEGTPTPDPAGYAVSIGTVTPTQFITKSTASVSDAVCTNDLTVTVTKAGAAAASVDVTLSIASSVSTQDYGKVEPSTGKTDTNGQLKVKYCGGDAEATVMVVAKAESLTTNSAEIAIVRKPVYTFTFKGVEEQEEGVSGFLGSLIGLTAGETNPPAADASAILLNLFGGGKDRITLLFEATASGAPYSGASAVFRSQVDYPVGTKLGLCSADVTTESDSATSKKYLKFDGVSNSSGLFRVPLCAARMPGNLLVSGTLTAGSADNIKLLKADATMVRFEGGLANYGNMSVAFDTTNAKVMKSSFVSNSGTVMNFIARLQSVLDGVLSAENPLGVLTEYGKVALSGDGKPGADGTIKFTVEPLNSNSQRPLRVTSKSVSNGTDYDVMCTPARFSATAPVPFSTLAKDWRSTVMYYVKGQEQYFDSNFNGQYDVANSVGFWDRNQNAVFDCTDEGVCDTITFVDSAKTDTNLAGLAAGMRPFSTDATICNQTTPNTAINANLPPCASATQQNAIYEHDWFIDMPSPFVDSDENGDQRVKVGSAWASQISEYVVGDSFLVPNGKWDREGYIWKSFVLPLYVGTSPYAMTHRTISSDLARVFFDNTTIVDNNESGGGLAEFLKRTGYDDALWKSGYTTGGTEAGGAGGVDKTLFGCHTGFSGNGAPASTTCSNASIFVSEQQTRSFKFWRYFFAQGTCGSPLPGGTNIKVQFESAGKVSDTLAEGGRTVSAHFYMQPNDWTLEPGRRLLAEATGLNTAKINSDPTTHPASKYSYPVQFRIAVSSCTNECTGDVTTTPGYYCPSLAGTILLTADGDTIGDVISVGQVSTCSCVTGASKTNGVCKCPTGKTSDGTTCL